jgi:hypothetical protein
MGNRHSSSEYGSPKLILDARSSGLPRPPHGHEYLIKSAYQSSMQPPRIPTSLGNSTAWPNSSKHALGSIDIEDGRKIKKRIHELTFLRKEQERQMEVISVLDRNSLIGGRSSGV